MAGPVALVGSGEYLPVMSKVDLHLLAGQPSRVVMLPTAAGQEGEDRLHYWRDLGLRHYEQLGVEAIVLPVLNRDDAMSLELADQIAGAGLIYLSGGSPAYLADSLRDTPVLAAIVKAWQAGAAVAGCSAGACALTAVAGGFRHPEQLPEAGLSIIAHLAVIPHFDRFDQRDPRLVEGVLSRTDSHLTLIGVDERTALVGGPVDFEVMGDQSVWWIDRSGGRQAYGPGTQLTLKPGEDPVAHRAS